MSKQILIVLSEWGYWGEELIGPLEACDTEGYEVSFVTPTGQRPLAHPVSMSPGFIDPPLGRSVVSEEMAEKIRAIEASDRLHNPLNLAEWLPVRPYSSSATYLRDMEAYYARREEIREQDLARYDALVASSAAARWWIWPTTSACMTSSSASCNWTGWWPANATGSPACPSPARSTIGNA